MFTVYLQLMISRHNTVVILQYFYSPVCAKTNIFRKQMSIIYPKTFSKRCVVGPKCACRLVLRCQSPATGMKLRINVEGCIQTLRPYKDYNVAR